MSCRVIAAVTTLFLVAVVVLPVTHAQNGTSEAPGAPSSSSATTPSQVPPAAPKKVWTNDNVTDLHDNSEISVVGGTAATPGKAGGKTLAGSKARNANWYRDQIVKLEAKLPPLDGQIEQLREAIDGKSMGDGKTSSRPWSVKGDSWAREEAELQSKRDAIAAHIDALRD
ncbi:MAG TPA: hypothetical protein VIY66_11860, partial [Candidatus Acidoferrales bacterium]